MRNYPYKYLLRFLRKCQTAPPLWGGRGRWRVDLIRFDFFYIFFIWNGQTTPALYLIQKFEGAEVERGVCVWWIRSRPIGSGLICGFVDSALDCFGLASFFFPVLFDFGSVWCEIRFELVRSIICNIWGQIFLVRFDWHGCLQASLGLGFEVKSRLSLMSSSVRLVFMYMLWVCNFKLF